MSLTELSSESRTVCTTSEAARLLGVSSTTVQIMVERGELRAWRTRGGHRRISLESVESIQRQRGVGNGRPRGESDSLSVLIVDNDAQTREEYRQTLTAWGWPISVLSASNGLEALLMIERKRPDVLIMDLSLPAVDGFDFLRSLREHHEFDAMHIIVVTALDDQQIHEHGAMPPGVAIYRKPLPFEKLQGFVEALIMRRALRGA